MSLESMSGIIYEWIVGTFAFIGFVGIPLAFYFAFFYKGRSG